MTAIKSTTKKAAVKKTVKAKAPVESVKSGSVLDLAVFDQAGKEVSKISLPKEVFGLKVNADLVSQTVTAQMANSRESIAHSKDRSEVRGGGKKPWKQKGTGRARHASIRSPLWAGGGATFGPRKERNFSLSINKKMKRQALKMVLSGKASDGEIIILESLKLAQPKTREMAVIINKLASGAKKELNRGVMIILSQKDEAVLRAARNLPKVAMIGVGSLNVVDLLSTKYLVISSEAVEKIKAMYQAK